MVQLEMKNYPIVIANPRTGSTFISQYIYHAASLNGLTSNDYLKQTNNWDFEYFRVENYLLNQKVQDLQNLRNNNQELFVKVMSWSLQRPLDDNKVLWDWFKEFYKNNSVYLIRRKNLWSMFVSYVFFMLLQTKHQYKTKKVIESQPLWWHATEDYNTKNLPLQYLDDIKSSSTEYQKQNIKSITKQFEADILFFENVIINYYKNSHVDYTILEYEDCNDLYLRKKLSIPLNNDFQCKTKKFTNIDYENLLGNSVMDIITKSYKIIFEENNLHQFNYEHGL